MSDRSCTFFDPVTTKEINPCFATLDSVRPKQRRRPWVLVLPVANSFVVEAMGTNPSRGHWPKHARSQSGLREWTGHISVAM